MHEKGWRGKRAFMAVVPRKSRKDRWKLERRMLKVLCGLWQEKRVEKMIE